MGVYTAARRLGRVEALDRGARPLAKAVTRLVRPGALKDVLTGKWLGHPLHPLLTDIPIGSLTSATLLDLVGGARSSTAADTLVAVGLAAAVPTALAGATDWSDTYGEDQRIGVVHALANTVGLGCYVLLVGGAPPGRSGRWSGARAGRPVVDDRRRLSRRLPRLQPWCRGQPHLPR
jgi:hypothetical protein